MANTHAHDYQIIVIGAGAGGLVVAIGMAKSGKKVLLIERGHYGGDCTNYGCIPSKSLIAAAHAAHSAKNSKNLGLDILSEKIHSEGALERTRNIVSMIRHHEEPEALEKKGVPTLTGVASFVDPHTLSVTKEGGQIELVTGDQIVIATGSSPIIPPIEGLKKVPFLTNETIFDLTTIPEHLCVIGGGPIGCELAQAFRRLGSKVTIIQSHIHLLHKEEPEAQQVIEETFRQEGIDVFLHHYGIEVHKEGERLFITVNNKENGEKSVVECSHLLISTGRTPNLDALNLETVGIEYNKRGIIVDDYGRTLAHKNIWAIGDIAGHAIFTHVAENEARSVIKNLLLPWPFKAKADRNQAIPRATFTDPEVASAGLLEAEAIKQYGANSIATYFVPFSDVDRAITAGRTEGFVKIVTKKWSSKILGVTIVAPHAGEMLMEVTTAMYFNIPLRKLANIIHPYPIYSQAIRKAADQWLTKTLLPQLNKLLGRK